MYLGNWAEPVDIHTANGDDCGIGGMDVGYFDEQFQFLRKWGAE